MGAGDSPGCLTPSLVASGWCQGWTRRTLRRKPKPHHLVDNVAPLHNGWISMRTFYWQGDLHIHVLVRIHSCLQQYN